VIQGEQPLPADGAPSPFASPEVVELPHPVRQKAGSLVAPALPKRLNDTTGLSLAVGLVAI